MNKQHEVAATFLANKSIGVHGVARKLGISQSCVSRTLRRSAINANAIRKQRTAQTRERMKSLRAQGWTLPQIADEMGYCVDYVRQVVGGAKVCAATGYTGVSAHGKRYKASCRINGKQEYLGLFATAEEAHEAYKAARSQAQQRKP